MTNAKSKRPRLERLELGGEHYYLADLDRMTFAQAHYLATHAQAAGIDHLWPLEGESDEDYEHRLRWESVQAADVPALLAGYLLPEGGAWSKAAAEATRAHLEALTDPDEHAQLLSLAARVAPDFFARALALFGTSGLSPASALPNPSRQTAAH